MQVRMWSNGNSHSSQLTPADASFLLAHPLLLASWYRLVFCLVSGHSSPSLAPTPTRPLSGGVCPAQPSPSTVLTVSCVGHPLEAPCPPEQPLFSLIIFLNSLFLIFKDVTRFFTFVLYPVNFCIFLIVLIVLLITALDSLSKSSFHMQSTKYWLFSIPLHPIFLLLTWAKNSGKY